jgi:hypothetical protein
MFCLEPYAPMVNSPFEDNYDENDDEHNQIELVMPALNMIQKFTTIFVHCYRDKKTVCLIVNNPFSIQFILGLDNSNRLHLRIQHSRIFLLHFSPIWIHLYLLKLFFVLLN